MWLTRMNTYFIFNIKNGTDDKGRKLEEFWEKSNLMLELSHKYIQWLFPSTSSSKYNSHAPILTEEDIRVLRNSMIAKQNMIRSLVLLVVCLVVALQAMAAESKSVESWLQIQDLTSL